MAGARAAMMTSVLLEKGIGHIERVNYMKALSSYALKDKRP